LQAFEDPYSVDLVTDLQDASAIDEIESMLRRVVILKSEHHYTALALWITYCHATSEFDFAPRLGIWSPEKRCGKSLLLEVVSYLVPNPRMTSSISVAALFRMIEKDESQVFLIDEADATFGKTGDREKAEALRQVLNSGFKRGQVVWRCDGKSFEPREFRVFCPVALAGIGTNSIPETVADRSIMIEMRRKLPGEKILEFQSDEVETIFTPLRDRLSEWVATNSPNFRSSQPSMPSELNPRARDLWKPLFKIAESAGLKWEGKVANAALALSLGDTEPDEASLPLRLLSDIREVFVGDRMSSKDLIFALRQNEESPWPTMEKFNPSLLAHFLKNYGVKPHSFGNVRGYYKSHFQDPWKRYLVPPEPVNAVSPVNGVDNHEDWKGDSGLDQFLDTLDGIDAL
jgi:hypothetical protein